MKNKFSYIWGIIFFLIFSYFYAQEYINFHENNHQNSQYVLELEDQKNNFQLENIWEISDLSLYQTPNKKLLDQIVSDIENAKKNIYLETYILTEKRIQQALKNAHKKWIDVQILMEKNPYKAFNINNKSFENLTSVGIPISWSDSDDFSLNHSKFIIIDDMAYISTGNFSYSTFTKNRDYYLQTTDIEIISILKKLFREDYSGNYKNFYHKNIVLSPYNSRKIFEELFTNAQESIDMYFQYLSDESLRNILMQTAKKWVKVRVIVRENFYQEDTQIIEELESSGIQIAYLKKPAMHSKAILVDNTYLFIGSINFSSYSLDKNRELGFIFTNTDIIHDFIAYYSQDWKK